MLKLLYTGKCDIYEYENDFQTDSKIINQKMFLKYQNVACRVSYYTSSNFVFSKEDTFNNFLKQKVKIFLDNQILIKAGSIFVVTQNDKITTYKNSSEPIIYTNHQEIILENYDDIS